MFKHRITLLVQLCPGMQTDSFSNCFMIRRRHLKKERGQTCKLSVICMGKKSRADVLEVIRSQKRVKAREIYIYVSVIY